jgi:tetratricopeptide (TPR) repeat protein
LDQQGRYAEALECGRRALELYRAGGDPEGQARAHNAIGWALSCLGEPERAIEHCEQALRRYQEIKGINGQAATWDSLGSANLALQRFGRALHCFEQALVFARGSNDRYNEARVLIHVGDAHAGAGEGAAALGAWRDALAILDDIGHPDAADVGERMAAA